MNNVDVNKAISFVPRKLTDDEIEELNIPYGFGYIIDSITKIDGVYYYYKIVNNYQMLNELIGSYLSRIVNLDAVDYKIGIYDKDLYALSRIFYEKSYSYTSCYDCFGKLPKSWFRYMNNRFSNYFLANTSILNKVNDKELILNILKLISIDLKMGQEDRHNKNLMFKTSKENNQISLAPIYDFSYSYPKYPFYPNFYYNPLVILRKNDFSLFCFSKKYPEIIDSAKILYDIPIVDVISDISKNNGIVLTNDEMDYYNKKDKEYTKLLKKLL